MDAIKTFRDLLSFLTIIPLAKTEDFIWTSSRRMYLFPAAGLIIGGLAAAYFWGCGIIIQALLGLAAMVVAVPFAGFLGAFLPAAMTLAFLLVLTGFQHFDGLVDLGNALGLTRLEDRKEIAHRWIVTKKGALVAFAVEFAAVLGLFLLGLDVAVRALIVAEVAAKLSMVTIVWRGKAAHQGLGARFIDSAKRKINIIAYATAVIVGFVLLGVAGVLVVAATAVFGLLMSNVANYVFGGVCGDMIGATNEAARALSLVLVAALWLLAGFLFAGALWF
ncbi:MAG: adenosylcobinamide-GDP ribazoletransferase [Candidatus Bathyarchaeota archaeon]|nr:adenosylcobinamide-GDP ribazoletransferase [Candidatus Bathyarchaeota archaeon]